MTKAKQSGAFKGHRFPPEIISYAVWAYFRFPMSFRDVEDILYKRGVIVSYETIRSWVGKFGHQYAKVIRRDQPATSDKWHLDEVVITIRGKKYWLWRAVDSKGDVLDILVQSRRNTKAADRFFSNCSSNTVNRASLLPTSWEVMGRPSGNWRLVSTIVPTRD
jgi:putative transposase